MPRSKQRQHFVVALSPLEEQAVDLAAASLRLPKTQVCRLAALALVKLVPPDALLNVQLQAIQARVSLDDYESFILSHLANPLSLLPQELLTRLQQRAERKGLSAVAELCNILEGELNRGRKKTRKDAATPQDAQPSPSPESRSALAYDPDDDVSRPAPATRCASCHDMFYSLGDSLCAACLRHRGATIVTDDEELIEDA